MKILRKMLNFGEAVYEIECEHCLRHFYFDEERTKSINVKCISCGNMERWDEVKKSFKDDRTMH